MQYRIDYFGFVYLWFDTKRKRYIIGSHFGSTDDGYTTSTGGKLVRRIFKARPNTMKRRIIEYISIDSLQAVRDAEQRWLDLRPNIGLNKRYYNCKNKAIGLDSYTAKRLNRQRVLKGNHSFQQPDTEERKKIRSVTMKKLNDSGKAKIWNSYESSVKARRRVDDGTHHFIKSDFNKKPFELFLNGVSIGIFESKEYAVKSGIPAHLIDKLRKLGKYTTLRNSYSKTLYKIGDIFEYKALS